MKGKGFLTMGLLLLGQTLWNQPEFRKITRRGAVLFIAQALTLMEKGQYLAVITKEEAADLWAEIEYRKTV